MDRQLGIFPVSPASGAESLPRTPAFSSIFSNLKANREEKLQASCVPKSISAARDDVVFQTMRGPIKIRTHSPASDRAWLIKPLPDQRQAPNTHLGRLTSQIPSSFGTHSSTVSLNPSFLLWVIVNYRINQEYVLIWRILSLKGFLLLSQFVESCVGKSNASLAGRLCLPLNLGAIYIQMTV